MIALIAQQNGKVTLGAVLEASDIQLQLPITMYVQYLPGSQFDTDAQRPNALDIQQDTRRAVVGFRVKKMPQSTDLQQGTEVW
ncbi:hypothetical protein [Occallatibacter riparius]|uniref:Uncharacterized protein n=1 Tax=Occallatibacter riparius TaxID=1002689 RepID=A0A9J7BIR4_9BACT|nr:hypothetical protein [Occallatibacter riparius]UWZ82820.1 hypothetical protein MOP44_19900 [Occallatibacter riparius]